MKEERKQIQKRNIVQWYEEEKRGLVRNMILVWVTVLAVSTVFAVAYFVNLTYIGAGAHSYSEQDYTTINEIIDNSRTEGIGVDIKNLRENLDECRTTSIGKKETILEGILDRGYFRAVVEVVLNENYEITQVKRNYNNEAEYMVSFWQDFGIRIVTMVLGIFAILTVTFFIIIKVPVTVAKVLQNTNIKKKEKRTSRQRKGKANSNNEVEVSV